MILQLEALQAVEGERLGVVQHAALLSEPGFQTVLEKVRHRLLEKAAQGGAGDRLAGFQRRQRLFIARLGRVALVQGAPFVGVGVQPVIVGVEIVRAERLQRVRHGQGVHRFALVGVPALVDVVAQLRHQHRGRPLAVVAHVAAGPADVEAVAGAEQGFQKQIAVVVAARAVAGPVVAPLAHQVEIHGLLLARVVAVLHAQQAHMAERDGAHRHQRAEVDAPGHEALRQALRVEGVEQRPARHGQRQRAVEIRFVTGGDPVVEGVAQAGVQVLVGFVHGQEQIVEQGGEALSPVAGAAVAAALAPVVFQGVEQAGQAPGQFGAQAGHFVQRLDAPPGRAVAEQVAGQHAFQAEGPAVLLEAGHVQGFPLLAVQPPADARLVDPAGQLRQVALVDAEAFTHRRHVQQVEDVGGGEAPLRQMQQRLDRLGQRRGGAGTAVAERVGQVARVARIQAAEHGVDVRRIGFDVRHHDDHVAGLQVRVGAEAVQQLVLQNLHLPLGAVADAEA